MKTLKIIKIGGNVLDNDQLMDDFIQLASKLQNPFIIVHGGGKTATTISHQLGIAPNLIDGRRITTDNDLDIVTMVYGGLINKQLTAKLQANGINAVGLSGADGNSIASEKRATTKIDYGWVGDIKNVNDDFIKMYLEHNCVPVFCALTHNQDGQLLNTNADTIASAVATAMSKHYNTSLIYCFEKNGVLENIADENSVIPKINIEKFNRMKKNGSIHTGMLPKLDNCFNALADGVQRVQIGSIYQLDGKQAFTQIV